jgi:very-short-patch-repair endonuclease
VLESIIADFVCFERRLVVDVDEPSHEDEAQKAADIERDAWLDA